MPNLLQGNNLYIVVGAAVAGLLVLLLLVMMLFRGGKKKKFDPEAGLSEDLSTYPPAPTSNKRHYQLSVNNVPVRLRLAVVAPVGKRALAAVDSVLEQVLRGLGEVSIDDKSRLRT